MRIVVTGSAGFIGQHLCRELALGGHTVRGVDIKHDPLTQDVSVAKNILGVLDGQDLCVHLAAKVGRLFGEDDVRVTVNDNAGMTAVVAQACGEKDVRMVYASTSEVYGDCGEWLAQDSDLAQTAHDVWVGERLPHNIYGLSKRWGEDAVNLYTRVPLILRLSMPYGPGLPAGRGRAALVNFLYNALHGEPITVHEGSERSWCWIGDTVRAIRLLIDGGHKGAFNVGRDDNSVSMLHVARKACELVGASEDLIRLVEAPSRQTVVKRLSTQKLTDTTGWQPEVSLEEGMAMTLDAVRLLP